MSAITDLKYGNDSSIEFCMKLTQINSQWSQQSEIFSIDPLKRQCILGLRCSRYSDYHYSMGFDLNFAEAYPCFKNRNFELTASFLGVAQPGFSFKLSKVENDYKHFKSDSLSIYNSSNLVKNIYTTDLYIKLVCLKHDSEYNLLLDIKELLNDENSDLKLIVKDHTFKVHKCILSVRSKIFNKMINTEMLEKQTSEVKLEDWNYAVVKQLLSFIYTGECDVEEVSHELFKLSHYLELTELENLCAQYLNIMALSLENIVPTLELAYESQFGLNDLKVKADNFVAINEKELSERSDYIEYLSNSVQLSNVVLILKFSKSYKLENLFLQAAEFIRRNYKMILQDYCCKQYLKADFEAFLKVFIYSLDTYESLLAEESDSS